MVKNPAPAVFGKGKSGTTLVVIAVIFTNVCNIMSIMSAPPSLLSYLKLSKFLH